MSIAKRDQAASGTSSQYTPARWGFYTPHKPVGFSNELVNPVTGEITNPPSMTKQEFVDQCNVNKIIKEFTITGQITHISAKAAQGAFIDLPAGLDYQNSLNIMIKAEEAFMALPAAVRDRFGNDPAAFLEFMSDPENGDEMIKMGLRPAKRPVEPDSGVTGVSPVANSAPASSEAPGGSQTPSGGQK